MLVIIISLLSYAAWSASDAVVGVEIAVDQLIDFYRGFISTAATQPAAGTSNIHYGGPRAMLDSKGGSAPVVCSVGSLRLVERQVPQVFIIVLRSEQQGRLIWRQNTSLHIVLFFVSLLLVYATTLRLQLLRQGIRVSKAGCVKELPAVMFLVFSRSVSASCG